MQARVAALVRSRTALQSPDMQAREGPLENIVNSPARRVLARLKKSRLSKENRAELTPVSLGGGSNPHSHFCLIQEMSAVVHLWRHKQRTVIVHRLRTYG